MPSWAADAGLCTSVAPAQGRRQIHEVLQVFMDLTVIKKNNATVTFADKRVKLEIIMLSKISQAETGRPGATEAEAGGSPQEFSAILCHAEAR